MKNVESCNLKDHILASPGIRCIGQMMDGFISFSLFVFVLWVGLESGIEKELVRVTAVSMAIFYYLFSDSFPNGQSMDKRILGIKVISLKTGKRCNIVQSLFRNILTPFLGLIDSILILGKKRQRLGDRLVRTVVVVS